MSFTDKFSIALKSAIGTLNAYNLAGLADVHSGDSLESPGSMMLSRVRDNVLEQLEYALQDASTAEDALAALDRWAEGDEPAQIADDGPNIYNYQRMQELVDLAAWDEDVSEFGGVSDILTAAGYALYEISRRLVDALVQEVREALESIEEDAIEEDEA